VMLTNSRPVVAVSFASRERVCSAEAKPGAKGGSGGCSLTARWLRQDTVEARHVTLITATGHVNPRDATSMTTAPADDPMEDSHLRNFACQSLMFNEQSQHFEPTANPSPCFGK
jgi:hypothetical protein